MHTYDFIDVEVQGGVRAGKTDAFKTCISIVTEKAKEGWELVQILPVINEKSGVGSLVHYTVILKK
ncbi:MAG: DUF4177 domain-containing protein [Tissierellia bacterium]|nr:DUF4177 domain-containing protein [Tissierellia bacterium]